MLKLFNDNNTFTKELHYYQLASKHGIAPKITCNIDDLIIISEKMQPLTDEHGMPINENVMDEEFIQCLDNKISLMHKLGFAHGDLSLYNIVYDNNNIPFIIDFEKSYQIHNHTWETELWMRKGYCWEQSYEDFVNYDYILWRTFFSRGMLKLTQLQSFNTHVNENYYDVRFNITNYNICCGSFAKCLQTKLGGTIYGISDTREGSAPAHYVLLTDKFIDHTGIYADEASMLKMIKSKYENELEEDLICYEVDQKTLNNKDYECDLFDKEIHNIVNYINNIINM